MTNLLIGRLKGLSKLDTRTYAKLVDLQQIVVNWKQIPNIMMKLYIEDKQIALVWFYEDADQDFRQKAKLKNF